MRRMLLFVITDASLREAERGALLAPFACKQIFYYQHEMN